MRLAIGAIRMVIVGDNADDSPNFVGTLRRIRWKLGLRQPEFPTDSTKRREKFGESSALSPTITILIAPIANLTSSAFPKQKSYPIVRRQHRNFKHHCCLLFYREAHPGIIEMVKMGKIDKEDKGFWDGGDDISHGRATVPFRPSPRRPSEIPIENSRAEAATMTALLNTVRLPRSSRRRRSAAAGRGPRRGRDQSRCNALKQG